MVPTPATDTTKAAALRLLTDEMADLGHAIDQEERGSPRRLELLRQQAALSDKREALRSARR